MSVVLAILGFVTQHWTDICTVAAVAGHFFQQKTIVAKLGEMADAAKNNPPSLNGIEAAVSKLNK